MPSESGQTRVARVQATTATYPPPNLAEPLPCPRCNSTKTKFCYYNNYNLAQPRYFCKSCRRYWTHGGTLRDIPVGGGTRRSSSKRHRSFSSTASSSSTSSSCSSSVIATTKSEAMNQGTATNEASQTKGSNVVSGYGSFGSLLGEGAFLALGSGSGGLDYSFGFGYGLEEMGVGYSEYLGAAGGEIPVVGGDDTLQIGDVEGKSGDSLIWPALEFNARQQC